MPFLHSNLAEIYYELDADLNSSKKILMLNGFTRPLTDFRSFRKHLNSVGISCLLMDLRGNGQSKKYDKISLDLHVSDIKNLLDELGISSIHVLGISMGGIVAQNLLRHHPNYIDSCFLVSTTYNSKFINKVHFNTDIEENTQKLRHYFSDDYFNKNQLMVKAIAKQLTKNISENHAAQQSKSISDFDFSDYLHGNNNKINFIHGNEDKVMPIEKIRDLCDKNSAIEIHEIAECGHLILAEKPKNMYQYVETVINRF